ncbi:unnamed protein product, partial [Amoebophrya sp. A120]
QTFKDLLAKKTKKLQKSSQRLTLGVEKIKEANKLVINLQQQLDEKIRPGIKKKIEETEQLIPFVSKEKQNADKIQEKVSKDATIVEEQQSKVAALQKEAEQDLNTALPALN